MYRRITVGLAALALAGCAHKEAAPAGGAQPTQSAMKISNLYAFDLYNCFPRQIDVPSPANQAGLAALWAASQPQIQECLIDPKSRGPQDKTTAKVDMQVSDQGVQQNVSGDNLTPDGQSCVQKVLASAGQVKALPAGSKPVSLPLEAQHIVGQSPAVQMGLNDVSDIAGTIRLSQKQWCECFQPYRASPPELLKAKIDVKAGGDEKKPDVNTVTIDPTGLSPAGQQVASCLQGKVQGLKFPAIHAGEVGLTYPFILINSALDKPLGPAADPGVAFRQLDGIRAQKQADSALALGHSLNAREGYDQLVRKYKTDKKAVSVMDLVNKCKDLVKTDEKWIAALAEQQKADQRTEDFVKQLTATNPDWGKAVSATQEQVTADENDVSRAKKVRDNDEKICPKVKY
jgi:hypothetical protein